MLDLEKKNVDRSYFEQNATIMGLETESRKKVTKPYTLNKLVDSGIKLISSLQQQCAQCLSFRTLAFSRSRER